MEGSFAVFCPLGSVIDFIDSYIFKNARNAQRRPPLYLQKLKYTLLFTVTLVAVTGTVFPLFWTQFQSSPALPRFLSIPLHL